MIEKKQGRKENCEFVRILETRAPYNIRGGGRRRGPNGERPGTQGSSRPSGFGPFKLYYTPQRARGLRVPFFSGKGPSRALEGVRNPRKMALTGPRVEKCSIFVKVTVTTGFCVVLL